MNLIGAPFVVQMGSIATEMYRMGWDERNGGNISILLRPEEVTPYLDLDHVERILPTGCDAAPLAGQLFLVTGAGKYFRHVAQDPAGNLGLIRIGQDGRTAQLLWGYREGGSCTSELPAHLLSHMARRQSDPENRVILHSHPTYTLAMTHVHPLDEAHFTHTLWQMSTECMMVFPDGVGVLPWMLCGTQEIGAMTAAKMRQFRLVVWAQHGIYGAGRTLDEAFGLIETVEKAAQVYLLTAHLPKVNRLTDDQLRQIAVQQGKPFRADFLTI